MPTATSPAGGTLPASCRQLAGRKTKALRAVLEPCRNPSVGSSAITKIVVTIPSMARVSDTSNTPQNDVGNCLGLHVRRKGVLHAMASCNIHSGETLHEAFPGHVKEEANVAKLSCQRWAVKDV